MVTIPVDCVVIYVGVLHLHWGRRGATNWKVADSIPAGVIGIFQ